MESLKTLLHEAVSSCSRSTVIQPIIVVIVCIAVALEAAVVAAAPIEILYIISALMVAVIFMFFWIYIGRLKKDPDSLRSEKYYFYKKAIETQEAKGMIEVPKEIFVIGKPEKAE